MGSHSTGLDVIEYNHPSARSKPKRPAELEEHLDVHFIDGDGIHPYVLHLELANFLGLEAVARASTRNVQDLIR